MLSVVVLLLAFTDLNQAVALLQKGLLALQHGQLAEARDNLERASEADKTNPYIWSSLAQVYWRLKEPRQAAGAAASAEKFGATDPLVNHALAMYYSEAGQPGKAARMEALFAESSRADPDALSRAAGLYLNAGDTQQALSLAREGVQKNRSAQGENVLGRALIASGENTEGGQHLGSGWQMAPTEPSIAFDYAQVLLRQQKFNEAGDVIAPALEAHPDNAQLNVALGVVRYGQRRFAECIKLFLAAIKADPKVEQPYVFLGRILDQAGDHMEEITADYQKWVRTNPRSWQANLLLAKALSAGGGEPAQIESLLRRSVALNDQNWEAHYELGLLLSNRHQYQAAADQFRRSSELDPKQPTPHYQLARAYDRLGQAEKAKAEREIHARLVNGGTRDAQHPSEHQLQ